MEHLRQSLQDFLSDGERRLSPATLKYYRSALGAFITYCEEHDLRLVRDLTRPVLRSYATQIDGTLSPGGVHARLRAVRVFVNWLVQEELLDRSPVPPHFLPRVPAPELPVVTEQDMAQLLQVAAEGKTPLRDRAILLTLFDTGLRASELCGLHLDHLLPDSTLYVRLGKGRKDRRVPVSKATRRAIQQYVTRERGTTDHTQVFLGRGQPLTGSGLLQLLTRLSETAGLSDKTPHAFRRGFAVSFIKHGADLVRLRDVLGHTSIAMSARYAVMGAEDLRQLHQQASPVTHLQRRRGRG